MSERTNRVHWIDSEIHDNRFPNAQKVADYFEVTERTAFEDYRYMRDKIRAPIRTKRGAGWYYTDTTYMLPFLALSEAEADTLRLSLRAAEEYVGETDAQIVGILLDRMSGRLPTGETESLSGAIHLASWVQVDAKLLQACRHAVRHREKLWLRYWGAHKDNVTERIVHPYRVHYYRGEPHLIAWSERDNEVRQFFLPRTRAWRLLEGERAFVTHEGFDIGAYLRQGLGAQHGEEPMALRVRFSPYQSRWIRERTYHVSQQLEDQPDGGVILTMQVAGRDEVRRWLQGFGAEVEVLEPATLRQEMAEAAKKVLKIYSEF